MKCFIVGPKKHGAIPGRGKRFISSPKGPHRLWGPLYHVFSLYQEALCPVVKRPGREADRLSPYSADDNSWRFICNRSVPWLRQSPVYHHGGPVFDPRPMHVVFVVDRVTLGRGFLRVPLCLFVSIVQPVFIHRRCVYDFRTLLCNSYSDSLRAGRSGDRIPVGARFSAPVQTSPGAHPASCTMYTVSLSRG
jgi:hypothetical protein